MALDPKYFDACIYTDDNGRQALRNAGSQLAASLLGHASEPRTRQIALQAQNQLQPGAAPLDICLGVKNIWNVASLLESTPGALPSAVKEQLQLFEAVVLNVYKGRAAGGGFPWLAIVVVGLLGGGGYLGYRMYAKGRARRALAVQS